MTKRTYGRCQKIQTDRNSFDGKFSNDFTLSLFFRSDKKHLRRKLTNVYACVFDIAIFFEVIVAINSS